ncbi:MAG: N-formylglutamate amidohydrolase [Bacteroidales bacterium]|nr:N-formylglutamate amidohydrolase [Bacteroidales bacterium]
MSALKKYSLDEIGQCLTEGQFPISGITHLGSTEFHFRKPANYLGVALHTGRRVRQELLEALDVPREDRFREEDSYTDYFVNDFPLQLIARDSRFEYDLNWEIEKCIYPAEEKKWGFQIWNRPLNHGEIETTYDKYKEFYALLDLLIGYIIENQDFAMLFDIHSYCYQRKARTNWWEDMKPEINLGTRYINRAYFSPLIDLFMVGVSGITLDGHTLRVAENDVFPGGYLTRKYAKSHNQQVLVLAIEFKKIFMDEWTGELYPRKLEILKENLLLTKDRIVRTKF